MGSCGTCMKAIVLLLTAIAGLVGVLVVFYAGVTVFDRDLAAAKTDKMDLKLKDFIKCDDWVADQMAQKNLTDANTKLVLEAGCQYRHTPALTLFCVGGTFALFSVLSGLVSGCKDVKGNLYAYTVISGAALALLVSSMFWMNNITSDISTWLTACEGFSAQTIVNINQFGYMCVESNASAVQFLGRVALFYGGCIVTIISLLSFLLMNSCCAAEHKRPPLAGAEVNHHGPYTHAYNRA